LSLIKLQDSHEHPGIRILGISSDHLLVFVLRLIQIARLVLLPSLFQQKLMVGHGSPFSLDQKRRHVE
jgi:hypothetical protein